MIVSDENVVVLRAITTRQRCLLNSHRTQSAQTILIVTRPTISITPAVLDRSRTKSRRCWQAIQL